MHQPTIEEQIAYVRRMRFSYRATVPGATYLAWIYYRGAWRDVAFMATKSREFVKFQFAGKTYKARYADLRARKPSLSGADIPIEPPLTPATEQPAAETA